MLTAEQHEAERWADDDRHVLGVTRLVCAARQMFLLSVVLLGV
jgi:hypothetical protein